MRNITLDQVWHNFMPAYERGVGLLSFALFTLTSYLILAKTPEPTKPFGKYLLLLQASLTLVDINYGFLVCPVILFPVNAGLCYGILCTYSGHVANSSMFFAVTFMAATVILVFHFKYVSIAQLTGHSV
ncbi:hypothetical protein PRIPAC_78607 [Pristionchus pacificus]|uniref:G protein-coupled receptor n=1 Tax=Pristionchus pacificus TaxID=54126 RepID=A0A2A6CL69_PRIPA|nr:hypothetical protein PRIPAC_78607 [Pristionchus pacificus]|eukprot:PDM78838.1 G protein-coupled receptor [Pristionchus pacificus]